MEAIRCNGDKDPAKSSPICWSGGGGKSFEPGPLPVNKKIKDYRIKNQKITAERQL